MNAKEELTKLLMESYDRGVNDAKQAAMESFPMAIYEAVRIEREACAKVCDEVNREHDGEEVSASWIAAAIRARGTRHVM